MKRVSISSICLGIVLVILVVIMIPRASGIGPGNASDPSHVKSGHNLFEASCVVCHGADGRGTQLGKSLGAAVLPSIEIQRQSDTMLIHDILDGKGNMPPFKNTLDRDQVIDLVQYVRVLGRVKK